MAVESVTAVDMTVNITEEVVIPPCTVNKGQTIEVNFVDIPVSDVVNTRFRQKKRYSCDKCLLSGDTLYQNDGNPTHWCRYKYTHDQYQ